MKRIFIFFLLIIPSFIFSQNILVLAKTSAPNFFENSKYIIRVGQKIKVVTAEKEFEGKVSEITDSALKVNDTLLGFSAINKIRMVTFGKIITFIFVGTPIFLAGVSVFFAATFFGVAGAFTILSGLLYDDKNLINTGLIFLGAAIIGEIAGYGMSILAADHLLQIRKHFDTNQIWKLIVVKS